MLISVFLSPNLTGNNGLPDSDYTRLKVFSDSAAHGTFDNYSYTFLYKWSWHTIDPEKPIEIEVSGNSETLPAIAGKTYDILGIYVVVSEVYDDYVVLLVKSS
jgi:hypothetical protein